MTIYAGAANIPLIPAFWRTPAPLFLTIRTPPDYIYSNAGDGYFYNMLPEIPDSFISEVYIGSNDPAF